ncbi:AAA family ATPase [Amycolatopsis sp. cg5]|uniref:ATP-binding protein n=1 Tax=Amycolatopsis sp. cg5 TaxID=3238802 RepID=UPI0035250E7D
MRLTHRCAECLTPLPGEPESGRTYCSNACRQRAYRRRMAGMPSKAEVPAQVNAKVLSNLPAQRDSFVGRERELGKLAALVRKHRLVTLSGGAGAGKTRLALAVASRVRRDLVDRVLLVELESTADTRFLPQTFAAALGVTERPDEPLRETIIATLRHMRALVVLDNCEHLLDACAELTEDLLRRCPDVVVFATSREALRLHDEVVLRVDGLEVPDPASSRRTDAVRLFVDRARERVPEFRLTAADAAAVAVLCARLDGSPLAIELAARWIPVLPVTEICARLDERFDLLTMGGRTKPARQRSLREAIDWSYWLLVPEERRVLRVLSVFVGEFNLEVARAVYGGNGDLGEVLGNLHAKSLVSVGSAPGRFRLLESIRLYAASRLEAAGELPSTKEALTRFFVDLAAPFVLAPLAVPNEVHQKVLAHRDALRVVITWTSGDRRLLLSTALAACTARMGFLADARKLLSEALDGGGPRTPAHCAALDRLAWYTGFLLEHDAALRMALDALEIASILADAPLITTCLTTLACIEQMSGKLELAAARRDVCLQLVRSLRHRALPRPPGLVGPPARRRHPRGGARRRGRGAVPDRRLAQPAWGSAQRARRNPCRAVPLRRSRDRVPRGAARWLGLPAQRAVRHRRPGARRGRSRQARSRVSARVDRGCHPRGDRVVRRPVLETAGRHGRQGCRLRNHAVDQGTGDRVRA